MPEKIKYDGDEWKLSTSENEEIDYLKNDYIELFNQYLRHSLIESLNDKIELLEEEEIDIEELDKESLEGLDGFTLMPAEHTYIDKINEMIRVINKIQKDNKIKEK